ncbi:hypothetical protein Niako_3667 [Niastella koreensis GR20-10]|uniref:Uncharacterized protein n=1 Tax=Niastella koreensis (strain DSM 17620 / KACC 11465 / NBRC 106392 / GR20-10) TaxID=700598 RepID=G8TPX1_NIAKG|nr:hypothetical protein Niako_3667 [Niastella koreensis GR20-10]
MVLAACFAFQKLIFNAVYLVYQIAIIVKTTFDMNCTKGHGEIFNKLTKIQKVI